MHNRKKKTKIIALLMAMAVGQMLPSTVVAQPGGGLLGKSSAPEVATQRDGMFGNRSQGIGYGIATEQFGSNTNGGYEINTEQFGAPLGSGLFILAAAGAAYAFSKRKKNN